MSALAAPGWEGSTLVVVVDVDVPPAKTVVAEALDGRAHADSASAAASATVTVRFI